MELTLFSRCPALPDAMREALLEFALLKLRNVHTRRLYLAAMRRYLDWLGEQALALTDVRPLHLAAYADWLDARLSPASIAAELSGIRRMYAWLVERQFLVVSPASFCRGPRRVVLSGKTPVLTSDQIARLLKALSGESIIDRRDRAIVCLMLFGFLRVSAVVQISAREGSAAVAAGALRVHEKGGQERILPLHPELHAALRSYAASASLPDDPRQPFFPASKRGRSGKLGTRPLTRTEVYAMVRRRLRASGDGTVVGCHSFRATGITEFLRSGGRIETAALLAGHASLRTTQLYDRRPRDAAGSELSLLRFERDKGCIQSPQQ